MLAFYCQINTFQTFPFKTDTTEKANDQLVLFSRQRLKPMWLLLLHSSVSWHTPCLTESWFMLLLDVSWLSTKVNFMPLFFFFFWATEKFKWKLAVIIHHNGATCRGAMHRCLPTQRNMMCSCIVFFILWTSFLTLYQSLAVNALAISNAAFFLFVFVLLKFLHFVFNIIFGPCLPVHSVKHV